jgi:hypothetical protein
LACPLAAIACDVPASSSTMLAHTARRRQGQGDSTVSPHVIARNTGAVLSLGLSAGASVRLGSSAVCVDDWKDLR